MNLQDKSDWKLEQEIEEAQSLVNCAISSTPREIYQERLDELEAEVASREESKK